MLRRILPSKLAEEVIALRRPLTCKDLLGKVRYNFRKKEGLT